MSASLVALVASGQLSSRAQTPAPQQPDVPAFVQHQIDVIKRDFVGKPHGYGTLKLRGEETPRHWLVWSDEQQLYVDVEGILTVRQVEDVAWKRFALANGVTRFTVDAESVALLTDLLRLVTSGFGHLLLEEPTDAHKLR